MRRTAAGSVRSPGCTCALPPCCRMRAATLFQRLAPAAGQHDGGALVGQRQRRRLADAAAGAGDPGDLSLEPRAPRPPSAPSLSRSAGYRITAVVIASAAKQSRPELCLQRSRLLRRLSAPRNDGEHHADPIPDAAAAEREDPRVGAAGSPRPAPNSRSSRRRRARGPSRRSRWPRAPTARSRRTLLARAEQSALAAGAAGGAAGRVLLPRADRAPGRRSPISARSTTTTSPRTS